jgi:hypothetical protein
MEGFMESFLYLLITIIILVLSMRKKKPVEHMEEPKETGDPFRDIFKKMEDDEYEAEEENVAEYRKESIQQEYREQHEAKVHWMTESDAKDSRMDMDRIMKEASEYNPIATSGISDSEIYGGSAIEDAGKRIDLKKAVIYSIILERKTF